MIAPMKHDDDKQLIAEATAGDALAVQQVMLRYYDVIEAAVRSEFPKNLASVVDPLDIIQDVLVDIHRGIGSYKDEENEASFSAWLRRIAKNRIVSTVRHYQRKKRGGDADRVQLPHASDDSLDSIWEWVFAETAPPERQLRGEEARSAIQVSLAHLNEDQRIAVVAHYFENADIEEIARRLERSPGAIRELLRRARNRLQDLLGSASAWLST